jgi:hypothetical protein
VSLLKSILTVRRFFVNLFYHALFQPKGMIGAKRTTLFTPIKGWLQAKGMSEINKCFQLQGKMSLAFPRIHYLVLLMDASCHFFAIRWPQLKPDWRSTWQSSPPGSKLMD